jgi:predicted RNA binding protein YcfA (HicA-like mRNA interferase family)
MPRLIPIKSQNLIKILKYLGFIQRDAEGSHVFFQHPDGRTTVIPVHQNKDISKGLLKKILNDLKINTEEYDKLRLLF